MSDRQKWPRGLRVLCAVGLSAIALTAGVERSAGQTSEIDSYDAAVRSQSKAEALNFMKTFGSSHLVGDLIESLPPEVAQQVCADLQGGGPAKARKACEVLREALAAQPIVPTTEIAPAAGIAAVGPLSANADISPGVPSDEPEGDQGTGDTEKVSGADVIYLPVVATVPSAGIAAVGSASTGTNTSTSAPPDHETEGDQGTGDTEKAGSTSIFLPAARMAPAAGISAAGSLSIGTSASTTLGSDDEPKGDNASGDGKDKNSAAGATDVDQPSAGGTSSGAGADTSGDQSGKAQSGKAQSDKAQSDNGQNSSDQNSKGQSSKDKKAQSGSDQSDNGQSGSDKKGNGKNGNGAGGKGKSGKGSG